MINRELEITFAAAIKEAKQRRHEFFTLEHILYAMLHDITGRRILYQDPIQTMSVQRVLQRALMHVHGAEKKEADAGDILAAMFYEENSYAVFFLKQQEVSRLDVLSYISHGISKVPDPEDEFQPECGGTARCIRRSVC